MTVSLFIRPDRVEHVDMNGEDLIWDDKVYVVMNDVQALDLIQEIANQVRIDILDKEKEEV